MRSGSSETQAHHGIGMGLGMNLDMVRHICQTLTRSGYFDSLAALERDSEPRFMVITPGGKIKLFNENVAISSYCTMVNLVHLEAEVAEIVNKHPKAGERCEVGSAKSDYTSEHLDHQKRGRRMRLACKAEIQPTPTQEQTLLQGAGNARWAYNWGLTKHKAAYDQWKDAGKPKKWDGWPSTFGLDAELNKLKKVHEEDGGIPWMYMASKDCHQQALRDLERAFKNFLSGRARYPRFKSRNKSIGGFRLTGTIRVDNRTIQLPCIGRVRIKPGNHGYIPLGKHSMASVKNEAGRWFVSVVGPEVAEAENNGGPAVGIDLGVAKLATLSDGTVYKNPRALKRGHKKIKRRQKELARKQRRSQNRRKAKRKLARAYARVRHVRQDALHKITTAIAKSHGMVVIEDLKVSNMTRKGGSRKRRLNRVLQDAALGAVCRMLEYKGKLYGCEVVAVNPAYTSQRCSACGHTEKANRPSQAKFLCVACGHKANADLNAAINILAAGSCPEALNAWPERVRGLGHAGAGVRRGGPLAPSQPAVKQELSAA